MDKFGGYVDFGGDLTDYINQQEIQELDGKVFDIWDENKQHRYQIADIDFLNDWINHNNFKLIK